MGADGVLGVLAIIRSDTHEDLAQLAARGALAFANVCTCSKVRAFKVEKTPWNLQIVHVYRAEAFAVEFTSLSHNIGCRVLHRLALDEEPDRNARFPIDRTVLPTWPALPEAAPALATLDVDEGSVGTANIATDAVTKVQSDAGFGTVNQDLPIASAVIGSSSAFVSQGGPLLVTASIRYYFEKYVNASHPTCAIRQFSGVTSAINLERSDGTLLVAGFIREALADGNFANKEGSITLQWKDTVGAGTHTYRVRVDNFACIDGGTQLSGTAGARMHANGQVFTIMELKR